MSDNSDLQVYMNTLAMALPSGVAMKINNYMKSQHTKIAEQEKEIASLDKALAIATHLLTQYEDDSNRSDHD